MAFGYPTHFPQAFGRLDDRAWTPNLDGDYREEVYLTAMEVEAKNRLTNELMVWSPLHGGVLGDPSTAAVMSDNEEEEGDDEGDDEGDEEYDSADDGDELEPDEFPDDQAAVDNEPGSTSDDGLPAPIAHVIQAPSISPTLMSGADGLPALPFP